MVTPEHLTALFTEHHDSLVRFLARQTGDRDLAEEIAQETFVRAMNQPEIASERSWLFAVAMNLVRDDGRRTARAARRLETMKAEVGDAHAAAEGARMVEEAEDRAVARRALGMLAERDRDALLMKEEGLGYAEIARALGLSDGSVGTTLTRARKRLVEAYEQLQVMGGSHG